AIDHGLPRSLPGDLGVVRDDRGGGPGRLEAPRWAGGPDGQGVGRGVVGPRAEGARGAGPQVLPGAGHALGGVGGRMPRRAPGPRRPPDSPRRPSTAHGRSPATGPPSAPHVRSPRRPSAPTPPE